MLSAEDAFNQNLEKKFYRGMNMVTQIQNLVGYKVVDKATATIIAIIPKKNNARFPEREFRHIPIWENE